MSLPMQRSTSEGQRWRAEFVWKCEKLVCATDMGIPWLELIIWKHFDVDSETDREGDDFEQIMIVR